MPTRIEELEYLLDELDAKIMSRYPEIEHAWLHETIAKKVQLEIKYSSLKK